MTTLVSRLWREPLLHFLLIGAAMFAYYEFAVEDVEPPPQCIHVERGQIAQLVANFQRTWSRPPTATELEAMIESHLREEVFYREALAMGLDRDDPMVRRRLRMKLEFMLEDLATQDVDDVRLEVFLQANAERFYSETQTSFQQVFLDPARRPQLESDAAALLAQLNDGADPAKAGDATLAPRVLHKARHGEVARTFGEEFATGIASVPLNTWTGPLRSALGAHLVRVEARVESRLPALAEIRDRVLREYQVEQRRQQKDLVYQRLREGYDIRVDSLDAAATGTAQ